MPDDRRIIGVDESGKGDFFGPLVVAAVLTPESDEPLLRDMAVRDGKMISENPLLALAGELTRRFPHAIVILNPPEYNQRYKKIGNLNKMLADGHAECIQKVLAENEADMAISDKFGKPELIEDALRRRRQEVDLRQLVRGEKILQVAAASIVARATFITRVKELSQEFAIELPRGASVKVDQAGRAFVKRYGVERLTQVAKVHFKNFQRSIDNSLFA